MTIERAQVARSSENWFKYLLSGVKNRRNCVKNSGSYHLKLLRASLNDVTYSTIGDIESNWKHS